LRKKYRISRKEDFTAIVAEFQEQAGEKLIRILAFTLIISLMSATMFNIVLPDQNI